jgi:hypothetical protein
MIKLLLTVQISYIEYSKIQTLVNATRPGLHIYRSNAPIQPTGCGKESTDIQDGNKSFENVQKTLAFRF